MRTEFNLGTQSVGWAEWFLREAQLIVSEDVGQGDNHELNLIGVQDGQVILSQFEWSTQPNQPLVQTTHLTKSIYF